MVSEPTIMDPVANNPSPLLLLNNMSNLMSIKLDSMNYMLWKLQISAILDAYSMIEHLDGSTQQPRQFIINEDVLAMVVGTTTAQEVWNRLEEKFTCTARANVLNLKLELQGIKKGNDSINSYLQRIKNTRDKLSAVGVLVDNEELLHMVLKGLPKEFASFASAIRTRDDTISFEKLSVLLQTEEQSMAAVSDPFPNSALAMFVSNNQKPHNGFNGGFTGNQGYNRGKRGRYSSNRGRGGRMDFAYQGKNPPTKLAAMASASNLQYTQGSETWLTDTGATDHITSNASNPNLSPTPYQGSEQVTVGNGQHLPIQSIVHKLCLDNNCSCHFDAKQLLIQDLPTGRLLYKGLSKDGVYPIHSSQFCSSASPKSAYLASSSALKWQLWHSRLGHPSAKSNPSPQITAFSPDTWLTTLHTLHCCAQNQAPIPTGLDSIPTFPKTLHTATPQAPIPTSGIYKPKLGYAAQVDYTVTEPPSYKIAAQHSPWCTAMQEEFAALQKQGTWSLVPPPPHKNIVGCKWVYKLKRHSDGTIARYKARLVAKGFHQQQGVDYDETFSPVVKPPTVRLILSLAVSLNWPLRQLDVKNAFLHGTLKEEVYMAQPQGYIDSTNSHYVCKLHKSIYGLKQAPRAWFDSFTTQLLHLGFNASTTDSSLFIYHHKGVIAYLLLYVDDIVLTSNSTSILDHLILQLSQVFDIKDLGTLHYFLGIQVIRTPENLLLTQTKYASDLLIKHHMVDSKPAKTPCSPNTRLSLHEGDVLSDPHGYRSLVGALHYLTFTRPDISFAVHQVCQYMSTPTSTHLTAAKRILRLVTQMTVVPLQVCLFTLALIPLHGQPRNNLQCLDPLLNQNIVLLPLLPPRCVGFAPYSRILAFILSQPPILWCNIVSALAIASNPVFHARTKHIEVDFHFIRERVLRKDLVVKFVSTTDQLADIFTKSLPTQRFIDLCRNLTVSLNHHSIEGECRR
uniref:Reverse transcriptase Ty1/copia-type domain-containing protein n=1 Tax=Fagus sylvatica TaxID=28930 RepID=A0A2N9G004_FAGSY